MVSLLGFWAMSTTMPPAVMLAVGAVLMAFAVALEYLVAQAWFGEDARQAVRLAQPRLPVARRQLC